VLPEGIWLSPPDIIDVLFPIKNGSRKKREVMRPVAILTIASSPSSSAMVTQVHRAPEGLLVLRKEQLVDLGCKG
jgi:hypothetical protein